MSQPPRILGLVLAGGRSSRFGSEKAVARIGGETLLSLALKALDRSCEAAAVSAPAGSEAARLAAAAGRTVLHDAPGDAAGPLAGIKAGLAWAGESGAAWLAVAPCDAPGLPPALYSRLAGLIGDAPAAMAETADGPQPLCSLWRAEALTRVEAALAGGAHPPVWRLVDEIGGRRAPFEDAAAFRNANTPEALAALQQTGRCNR